MTYSNDLKERVVRCIHMKKYSDIEIIEIFDIGKTQFYKWKKESYKNNFHRKSKITIEIKKFIINYVTRKINFDHRELKKIILRKYDTSISSSSIYGILKNAKIKKKKIYTKMILTNQKVRKKQIKIFKEKINKFSIRNIISIDETSIDSHIINNYGWSKSGKKVTITKTYTRIRYTLISAIKYGKIIHSKIIKGSANGEIFLSFMKGLSRKIPSNKKYGIILDNARIHHYGKLKKYMNNRPLLDIIYNVPYSPESNPIENIFSDIKRYLRNTKITNNNIHKKINESLSVIKSNNIKNYFKKSYNYY